jgi:hypothetical protein
VAVVSGIMYGLTHPPGSTQPAQLLQWQDKLTREEFKALMEHVDRGMRALPATAQVRRHHAWCSGAAAAAAAAATAPSASNEAAGGGEGALLS